MIYVHVWDINICFEIAMTKRIPPIKFLATPLLDADSVTNSS